VLFYNLPHFLEHPGEILWPFRDGQFIGIAGMSYHGGMIGAAVGGLWFLHREKVKDYWMYLNLGFLAAPAGYTWGRLGNFLNGELYGRTTDAPIGMLFPTDPTKQIRHPSQAYEMIGEGILLFGVLLFLRRFEATRNMMFPCYLMGYGIVRFFIEYFREPDAHIGLSTLGLSRGQFLCVAMILAGVAIMVWKKRQIAKTAA
jgi:phosphatidylglycerol:prolipoprotein diacylglycerol transferase